MLAVVCFHCRCCCSQGQRRYGVVLIDSNVSGKSSSLYHIDASRPYTLEKDMHATIVPFSRSAAWASKFNVFRNLCFLEQFTVTHSFKRSMDGGSSRNLQVIVIYYIL